MKKASWLDLVGLFLVVLLVAGCGGAQLRAFAARV